VNAAAAAAGLWMQQRSWAVSVAAGGLWTQQRRALQQLAEAVALLQLQW
jgi:hypothetical protein